MTAPNPSPLMPYHYGDIPQAQNDPCSSYFTRIKRTAIIQLVGGCLLVAMGIVAIILMAFWSYFATAIWSGILIFSLTGVIGILAASKGSKCLARAYLTLSIFACFMGFALFEMHIFAAVWEDEGQWHYGNYYEWNCQPGGYYSWIPNCAKSEAARQTFDGLISFTGFFLFITSIVAASFGCCASCKGCESCCKQCCCNGNGCSQCCTPPPQPVTAIFQPQGPTFAPTGQQQAGMYIVQQGPAPMTQFQQVAMPAPAPTNHGQASFIVMPAGSQMQASNPAPPPSQPHTLVAPPGYYVAGQGQVHFPPVEQPDDNQKA